MQFARRVFLGAGIYGLLVLSPMYFLESRLNEQLPPPITHPEFYYGFAGLALVWQLVFLFIARHPIRQRPLMLFAILEKLSYGLAVPMLFATGRVGYVVLSGAVIDLVWAVLFAVAYGKTPGPEAQSL